MIDIIGDQQVQFQVVGYCGCSGSESDIWEYELWVYRDRGDFDVSFGYVQYKSIR